MMIKNSICVPVISQKCGLCLCAVGFKKRRGAGGGNDSECVPIDNDDINENDDLSNAMSTDFTKDVEKCAGKDCATVGTMIDSLKTKMVDSDSNIKMRKINVRTTNMPMMQSKSRCPDIQSREIPCPMIDGGVKTCYSGYCFQISEEKSFCICTHGRIGKLCQTKKIGDCSNNLTMRNLDVAEIHDNSRFRHNKDPDYGSILGRHFAKSLNDCMKLCLWATSKQCRSINYGPINKKMICELISISATRDDKNRWIIDDQGWKYVTDFV
uniref:EGF-like domain-containing protein n=1 Tax=Romanomermis culicivorax TaxID=13658 RepID=A0A915KBT8_ROMCU